MLAVSGASGHLGGLILRHLLGWVDASRVVALSRTPDRVPDLGIRTRAADFAAPDGLVRALDGVERLLLVSVDAITGRAPLHAAAIKAATKAGVGHIIYTSTTRAGDPGNPSAVAPDHHETERLLAASVPAFTSLRFNIWPETLTYMGIAQRAVAAGELPSNAGDGRVAYLTRDDSAAVAAAVLAEGGSKGELLEITGPAAVSDADLAAILAETSGRPVRHVPVAEAAPRLTAMGTPAPPAQAWAGGLAWGLKGI
ncbi:NAD(P)H-binding protein [Actinomadura rubrisoli]|uniref:NmrA family transcriptional regulator n=1 Tax=Actinomadura rubrisoli TaxID=2530368 RepID=A0A4R5AZY7_9ACTN|nr:NAD(P)H-binding protein [Actinomadura rubrisoli]TDD77760.1 NmrA family transcriptional regulator [Actinomadura rubrisoli]